MAKQAAPHRPDWLSPSIVTGLSRFADCAVVCLTGLLAYYSRFQTLVPPEDRAFEMVALVLAVLLTANIFQLAGLYQFGQMTGVFAQAGRLVVAWSVVIMVLVAIGFATRTLEDASRLWVGLWYVYGFCGMLIARMLLKHQILRWQHGGRLTRNIVVVGAGEHGQLLCEHLRRHDSGVRVIGLFDDRTTRIPDRVAGFPVLGTVDDLLVFARNQPIDQIVVALPWHAEARLLAWMKKLKTLPLDVRLCPDRIGFHLPHRKVAHLAGVPLLGVFGRPLSGWAYVVKAAEDRLLASLILVLVAPLMLLIALLVRLDSRGPALYRQRRYGFNNEVIEVFKFRTMYADSCDMPSAGDVAQARRDDPRVTRIGGFLRRTSLDELPQFLNVLNGTMSIVGPRPHAVAHNERYAHVIDEYLARHRVKPGITGWAQVNGLRGETDTIDKMEKRVAYDLYYIEHWSLAFDLRIILRTLFVGFTHPNAY